MDDILIENNSVDDVVKVNDELGKEFNMNNMGDATRILGIDI